MKNIFRNRKSQIVVVIVIVQGIMGITILNSTLFAEVGDWQVSHIIRGVYALFNIVGMIGVKYFVDLIDKEVKYQQLLAELKKSDEVVYALRAHKHDFFNHLQIIMGLAQLEGNDRIVDYIHKVSQDVSQSYDIANIHIPEITVVLMQKLGEATHRGIKVETLIKTTCEGLRGEGIHHAQVLFNLLDNAIFELDKLENCEKILRVEIEEEKAYFQFVIFNNLPIISEEVKTTLFERGFTTKEGNHDGLGLWNVEKLVHRNSGLIRVESEPDYGTSFKIIIPK